MNPLLALRRRIPWPQLLMLLLTLAIGRQTQSQPNAASRPQPSQASSVHQSFFSILNDQARHERDGDPSAIPALARGAFSNAGIPPEIADAFGITDRIVQAQKMYRAGAQPPVGEDDIVTALNNFANSMGTPAWTHTSQPEVRKLRMRLLVALPQLFANEAPPDAKGHRQILSPNLSPLEASFLAVTMLHAKVFSSDFQFTDAEQAQNRKLDPAAVDAMHLQRTGALLDLVNGRSNTFSVRDLLDAGDRLLTDLKIPETSSSALKTPPLSNVGAVLAKGGL